MAPMSTTIRSEPEITILGIDSGRTIDGIRDHGALLVSALNKSGSYVARYVLREPGKEWIEYRPDAFVDPYRWLEASPTERRQSGSRLAAPIDSLRRSDVVLVQYNPFMWGKWGFAPWLPWMVRRLTRRPTQPRLALMVHEPYVPMVNWRWALMGAWQRLQLVALRAGADLVLTSIEAWADRLQPAWPRRPTLHLPVGSNLPDARHMREQERNQMGLSNDSLVLAMLGTERFSRSFGFIRGAVNAVAAAGHDVVLLNLGSGAPVLEQLHTRVRVHRPGELTTTALARQLAMADVFMAPFVDGVSTRRTTLIAALQHGLAVVGTDGPLTDPCLRQAEQALRLVPVNRSDLFAAATLRLACNLRERERLARAARNLYDKTFAWPVLARRLLNASQLGVSSD